MKYQDEFDVKKLLIVIPLFVLLVFLLASLVGCGVSKRAVDTYSHEVDSSFTTIKKEEAKSEKDSSGKSEKSTNQETNKSDSSGVKAEFYDSDSSKPTGPVVIKVDSNGTLTIDPGGRNLKSVSNTRKRTEKKQEQTKASDSTHVVNTSNINKLDSSGGKLTISDKTRTVKRSSFQIPWYAYVIFIAIGILVWFFWPHIKSAKAISDKLNKVK